MESNSDHINAFLISISIVGLIGNLIVAFVYWQKKDKQTSTFFILVLAFIDLTVCCLMVPMIIYIEHIKYETDNLYFCKLYYFLLTTTVPSSSLLMTAIAIDRYFFICMANVKIITYRRAKIISLVLLMVSASLGVIPAVIAQTKIISKTENSHSVSTDDSNKTYIYYDSTNATYFNQTETTQCYVNMEYKFFGVPVLKPFKYSYDFIFLAAVVIITSLYILIYKEIYTRRKTKRDHKRKLLFNSYVNSGGLMFENSAANESSCFYKILCMGHGIKKPPKGLINDEVLDPLKTIPLIQITSPSEIYDQSELEADFKRHQDEKSDVQIPASNGNHKIYEENSSDHKIVSANSNGQNSVYYENNSNNNSSKLKPLSKQSLMRRKSITSAKHAISTKDIRTAFMLFVVSFLFLVFYLPSIVTTYLDLFQVSNVPIPLYITYLYFSNSAINPMIYCFLNPTFRADLVKLFFKRGFLFSKCVNNVNLK